MGLGTIGDAFYIILEGNVRVLIPAKKDEVDDKMKNLINVEKTDSNSKMISKLSTVDFASTSRLLPDSCFIEVI